MEKKEVRYAFRDFERTSSFMESYMEGEGTKYKNTSIIILDRGNCKETQNNSDKTKIPRKLNER